MIRTSFETTESGLVLTDAILLYRTSGGSLNRHTTPNSLTAAFASIHPVDDVAGHRTIGAGAPLSRAHLRQWTAALGRTAVPEILPDNVLVAHPDLIAWWLPEQVRTAYVALTRPPAGAKALARRTTLPLPYPAHLLVATRAELGVYALPASTRPTADTPVLHSPVLNVFVDGKLCWGNIAKPKALTTAAIPEYERAVFDSWSTHPNAGQEATVTGKGGLVRLWDDLAARGAKHFPVKRLKPFNSNPHNKSAEPMTLGRLIAGSARS